MNKTPIAQKIDQAIDLLQVKRDAQYAELKQQFTHVTRELRPNNLLENTLGFLPKLVPSVREAKGNLLNTALGIATNFISQKFLKGKKNPFLNQILGLGLQIATTKLVNHKNNIN